MRQPTHIARAGTRLLAVPLMLSLLLAGCGFQLKGTSVGQGNNSLTGRDVAIVSVQPRSELTAAVIQQLKLEGANVVTPSATALTLKLGAEQFAQRNLSLTAQARSAEVELTMTTRIELLQSGEVRVTSTDASVIRQFLNDPRNVVGKTEELRLLRDEMRRDLAAQITRRISHSLAD